VLEDAVARGDDNRRHERLQQAIVQRFVAAPPARTRKRFVRDLGEPCRELRPPVEQVREYTERKDAAPAEGFGSLADRLRGALEPREE
jgi:hypothetical protein